MAQEPDQQTPKNGQNAPPTTPPKQDMLKLRKYILLLASLVATVTYAAAFSPPGDVWQDTAADHLAGDPIIRDTHHRRYVVFFYCNATAFAGSLVVIVLVLILASLDDKDNRDKYSKNMIALRTLQAAMVVDLLSLMGAYAAGTCRDTFTTTYSSVLVGVVVLYLVFQMTGSDVFILHLVFQMTGSGGVPDDAPASPATGNHNSSSGSGVPEGQIEERHPVGPDDAPASPATGNPNSSSGGGVPEGQVEERHPVGPDDAPASPATGNPNSSSGGGVPHDQVEEGHPVPDDAPAASPATGNPNFSSGGGVSEPEAVRKEERQKAKGSFRSKAQAAVAVNVAVASMSNEVDKTKEETKEQFPKVLMLLATFAVSITYLAGLSTPGGFWDTAGPGHGPGDAILKERHNTRLAVFLCFNTMAFVASLLIIVVLLDTKSHHRLRRVFIVAALFSLIVAYNAGSCRQTDTTVYVGSLIGAVAVYILFLYRVAEHIHTIWEAMEKYIRNRWLPEQSTPSIRNGRVNTNSRDNTEKGEAAKRARSLVLLLATLAATITFQAGLDPPGGVWQDNSGGHTAGDPILLTTNPRRYKAFFYCNSVSLVASLVAMVPVESELLLEHHVLEAVMILDLFGLIGAYAAGSCRDVTTSIHAMALAGAVLVYVVIHVIFITLDDDDTRRRRNKRNKDSVEKTRKRLLLFAIFVATITYQAGLTPPGGFLQSGSGGAGHNAGDPVLLYNFPRRYKAFFYCNSVSFMLSIALIILLVNPYVYRPAIRTHALSVCTAAGLFGLMGAYAAGSTQHFKTSVYIFALVAVVIFFILLLFLVFWYTGCRTSTEGTTAPHDGPAMADQTDSIQQLILDRKKRERARPKYLMLLGILVASVTYQAGLAPPGGAWQRSSGWYEAGNPVLHDNRRHRYLAFFYSNSTSFMASVVVILLLLVERLFDDKTWRSFEEDKTWRWRRLVGFFQRKRWLVGFFERKRWLVVMNTTIVLDLLGLLGAYAAGSSRRWKTSVYVLLLVIAVLAYMGFHLLLSCTMIRKRRRQSAQLTASPPQVV